MYLYLTTSDKNPRRKRDRAINKRITTTNNPRNNRVCKVGMPGRSGRWQVNISHTISVPLGERCTRHVTQDELGRFRILAALEEVQGKRSRPRKVFGHRGTIRGHESPLRSAKGENTQQNLKNLLKRIERCDQISDWGHLCDFDHPSVD
jgi:hypothetical protein